MSEIPRAAVRAVLFDAHGVLITGRESVGTRYARCAARFGVDLPAWRLDDAFGRVLRHAPPRVFPDARASEVPALERGWWRERVRQTFQATDSTVRFADFDAFFEAVFRDYEGADAWRCAEGVPRVLRALRARGLPLGVASNFDHRLRGVLQALDLAEFFDVVMTPAECGAAKPDARLFEAACRALGRSPAETLYVGEAGEDDLGAALRAGLQGRDARVGPGLAALPAWLDTLAKLG